MPWLWGRRPPRPFSSETHEGKKERKQKKEARSNGLFLDKLFLANETEFKIDKTCLLKKNALGRRARCYGSVLLRPCSCGGASHAARGAARQAQKGGQNPQRALHRAAPDTADTKHGRKSSHPGPQRK
jgi:hypothetical protein